IGATKQILADRLADNGDIGSRPYVVRAEAGAAGERPFANVEILWFRAGDTRAPVVVAIDDLGSRGTSWSGLGYRRTLAKNCLHIFVDQRLGGPTAHSDATTRHVPSADEEHVRSHGSNLLLYLLLRALPDTDGRDDGSNANHNAQHGEQRTHLIPRQRAKCN